MNESFQVVVVTLEGDIKYQVGKLNKSVDQILNEINECKAPFYKIIPDCAVKKDKIMSVESVQYNPNEKGDKK